ncbi:MAG: hypothetical protein AB1487_12050 [Thermodesulfobacteriota bacterium]
MLQGTPLRQRAGQRDKTAEHQSGPEAVNVAGARCGHNMKP